MNWPALVHLRQNTSVKRSVLFKNVAKSMKRQWPQVIGTTRELANTNRAARVWSIGSPKSSPQWPTRIRENWLTISKWGKLLKFAVIIVALEVAWMKISVPTWRRRCGTRSSIKWTTTNEGGKGPTLDWVLLNLLLSHCLSLSHAPPPSPPLPLLLPCICVFSLFISSPLMMKRTCFSKYMAKKNSTFCS